MNLISIFLFLLLTSSAFALTPEEDKKYDELEGLEYLRALAQDKKYSEVIKSSKSFNNSSKDDEFYLIVGESYLQVNEPAVAYQMLKKIKKPLKNFKVNTLLGRSTSKLNQYRECSGFYQQIPPIQVESADWPIYFNCLKENESIDQSINLALNEKVMDEEFFLLSQKVLLNNHLHYLASLRRSAYLNTCHSINFYLLLLPNLSDSNSQLELMESAHFCHPEVLEITSALVKVLFDMKMYHSIAIAFENFSFHNKEYFKHTAEFYKISGRKKTAEYFYEQGDLGVWELSRATYFLDRENYSALLTIPFRPEVIKENKDLAYAIAYSQFKYLSLDKSDKTLNLYKVKADRKLQLQSLLTQCRNLDWKCRP